MSLEEIHQIPRKVIEDKRGWFCKIIDGKENKNPNNVEVYLTSAKPGESKGGHYHKIANEWFTLVKGKAKLHLLDIHNNKYKTIDLSDGDKKTIFVPPFIAHEFENSGNNDFILVAYTDTEYCP
ncbi:MAG: WxcM-like domain-containing protein, partial [bacterium]